MSSTTVWTHATLQWKACGQWPLHFLTAQELRNFGELICIYWNSLCGLTCIYLYDAIYIITGTILFLWRFICGKLFCYVIILIMWSIVVLKLYWMMCYESYYYGESCITHVNNYYVVVINNKCTGWATMISVIPRSAKLWLTQFIRWPLCGNWGK